MTENGHRVLNSRYRIEALIGRGGMADVYLGHDLSLDRQVAVKMLRPDLARDPQFQGRFRREAQSSASLNHHNIVGVYDTGRTDVEDAQHTEIKTPYIVMEYIDGVTLRHIMHGTPRQENTGDLDDEATVAHGASAGGLAETSDGDVLDLGDTGRTQVHEHAPATEVGEPLRHKIDEALGKPVSEQDTAVYMAGILGALSYSHEKGIVHRDIKPSNVMVGQNGAVKVMDFGIARALADSASTMTQTSAVVGTAQYLSPEQARGEIVDHRSDLYSAGCVMFELLTNRPPFQGESPVSVAYQHVREEAPLVSDLNPQVSPAMESVVSKALTKDPAHRFQNADDFASALRDAVRGVPVEDATQAMAAVGSGRGFDEVVGAGAAGLATPLSARTPEDPDLYDEYEEDVEEPRRRRRFAWLWVLLLIALVAGGTWALVRMLDAQELQIPEVEGMSRSEALETLSELNIDPTVDEVPHEEIEEDLAIGTDPEAGTQVEPEDEVTLFISSGPGQVVVPDGLQGEPEDTVRTELEELGLEIGDVSDGPHPSLEVGTLISTYPEAGTTVDMGDPVDLTLSNGLVELPNVIGMTESEATSTLESSDHQLTATPFDWETTNVPVGTVLAMHVDGVEVDAGDQVAQGATVTISVAVEPPEEPEEPTEPTPTEEPGETRGPDDEDDEPEDDETEDDEDEPEDDETNGPGNNGNGNGNNGNNGNNNGNNGNGNDDEGDDSDEDEPEDDETDSNSNGNNEDDS